MTVSGHILESTYSQRERPRLWLKVSQAKALLFKCRDPFTCINMDPVLKRLLQASLQSQHFRFFPSSGSRGSADGAQIPLSNSFNVAFIKEHCRPDRLKAAWGGDWAKVGLVQAKPWELGFNWLDGAWCWTDEGGVLELDSKGITGIGQQ